MNVHEIERAISELPQAEVAELAAWFEQFHARVWDAQLEDDIRGGRLDSLLDETARDLESGRCESL
jgi:hypothetical protein